MIRLAVEPGLLATRQRGWYRRGDTADAPATVTADTDGEADIVTNLARCGLSSV